MSEPHYGPSGSWQLLPTAPQRLLTDQRYNTAAIVVSWLMAAATFAYMLPWAIAASRGKSSNGEPQGTRHHKPMPQGQAAGRLTPAMSALDMAELVRGRLVADRSYARQQRRTWRALASVTKLLTLLLSAAATVILGIAQLDGLAQVGFVMSALVTTASAIEPYFNWRSRWVLAEEALHTWYQLEEDLTNLVARRDAQSLDREEVLAIDAKRQEAWDRFGEQWLRERRSGQPAGAG